jgi:hypothetical protein
MAGLRPGAFDWLYVRNLEVIEATKGLFIGVLKVYEGETEEYFAFLTPEAVQNWLAYKCLREQSGEIIGPNSPLVRNAFRVNLPGPVLKTLHGTVQQLLRCKWNELGLSGHRDFGACKGFRSIFRTRIKTAGIIDKEDAEHMLGHKDANYRPDAKDELLAKFAKCYQKVELSKASEAKQIAMEAVQENKLISGKVMDKLRPLELENEKYRRENNERMARNEKALKETPGQNLP